MTQSEWKQTHGDHKERSMGMDGAGSECLVKAKKVKGLCQEAD